MKKVFEFIPLVIVILVLYAFVNMANAAPLNRQKIKDKLNNTIVTEIEPWNSLTISEVMRILPNVSSNRINFFYFPLKKVKEPAQQNNLPAINPFTGKPAFPAGVQPPVNNGINPNTGLPFQAQFQLPAQVDLNTEPKIVGMNQKIRNLTLKQLLDVMVMSFDHPMNYFIVDYGVIIKQSKEQKTPRLFNRTFLLNPWAARSLGMGNGKGLIPIQPENRK